MDKKKHGDVIIKYDNLNLRLKKHGLMINAWGRLAVAKIDNPNNNFIINNIDTIEEIEAFCCGVEFMSKKG